MKIKFAQSFYDDMDDLFSSEPIYVIKRFFKWVIRIPIEIKWFLQRGFRGYDDTSYWDLDDYLGKEIIRHLKQFKNANRVGVPDSMCFDENGKQLDLEESSKRWNETLDKMIFGFEELIKDMTEKEPWRLYEEKKISYDEWRKLENEEYAKAQENAMLFIKYFNALWD
jgi:hypothetical protein